MAAMLVGATHIDHVDRLRAGATSGVLGFKPAAPSTVGSFLRSFTWGHVRQLDRVAAVMLGRAWANSGGPGEAPMTIDVDSTVCPVVGKTKAGAAYGYTNQLGYHPLVAVRAGTGEVLHARLRGGSPQRGNTNFIAETIRRARRAGAAGELCVRADSGFFSYDLLARLDALEVRWSVTIPLYAHVEAAIGRIAEADWAPAAYRDGGAAHVAETTLAATIDGEKRALRLVARRSRLSDPQQAALWPTGATTPSSLTATTSTPPPPTPITANTPPSNSPSGTSKRAPASPTCRRGASPPTPPGSPAPHSHTTSTGGSPDSPQPATTTNSPSDAPSAATSSPYPGAS